MSKYENGTLSRSLLKNKYNPKIANSEDKDTKEIFNNIISKSKKKEETNNLINNQNILYSDKIKNLLLRAFNYYSAV